MALVGCRDQGPHEGRLNQGDVASPADEPSIEARRDLVARTHAELQRIDVALADLAARARSGPSAELDEAVDEVKVIRAEADQAFRRLSEARGTASTEARDGMEAALRQLREAHDSAVARFSAAPPAGPR
jgi:hypothetical protein